SPDAKRPASAHACDPRQPVAVTHPAPGEAGTATGTHRQFADRLHRRHAPAPVPAQPAERGTAQPGGLSQPAAEPVAGGTARAPARGSAAADPQSGGTGRTAQDRKSTRLNSSHVKISYAVLGLKKRIQ